MGIHCKIGESAKVFYTFGDDPKKEFIYHAGTAPIEVVTGKEDNPNITGEMYAWNFSTSANPRTTLEQMPFAAKGKLTGFRVERLINTATIAEVEYGNWECSFLDGDGNRQFGSAVGYYPNDTPKLVKLLRREEPLDSDFCKLEVKTFTGETMFKVTGKCPVVYRVACLNCPEGEIECTKSSYPGYCCIPCQDTASRIRNLGAKVNG
ncbi:hypothetical protein CAL7716_072260 [Calothrix sp. PCC 7716]|nr:hypothetical protein CAL7716_072260 [Calothrix sp. PCC 7716]